MMLSLDFCAVRAGHCGSVSVSTTSNDLLADRRFAWAKALAEAGDDGAAADLLEQVIALVPAWIPAWAALAEAHERVGSLGEAARAWGRVGALDPGDIFGAEVHLARLQGRTPPAMADAYIRALFDDYAPRFERHLTGALEYRGPAVVIEALERAAPGRVFARALDLGCGTGLMAGALGGRAVAIDGVDLSPAMVERARHTGRYASLTVGSLDTALAASPAGAYDLVIAADVLVYLGDLAPVLAGVARTLVSGGLMAFTVQETAEGDSFGLGTDMRFSHSRVYVADALSAAGLRPLLLEPTSTRREKGIAVPGFVAVASR